MSFFSFSYALLIVLNRSGLFTILPTHNDENSCFSIELAVSDILIELIHLLLYFKLNIFNS